MTYSGATVSSECRILLGEALEALQKDPNIPPDVLNVAENIAKAVGALFEAERASTDLDGKSSVRYSMRSLSQTLALLQDVRSKHKGIEVATNTIAQVMSRLYPLAPATVRPSVPSDTVLDVPKIPKPAAVPSGVSRPVSRAATAPREKLEANIGATTESNFFVGFSGEISEGGVFIATYMTLQIGTSVEVFLTLPGGFEATIPGKVLFVRDPMDMESDPGIGIQFETLSTESRELILRFIRKRPPLFFDF
ncbi:MAG: PilZ domain-containing protein [Deltaproteobacteria bacterium]|nr:PilZ domain-containing protein [Deltaproteobacteria bacterium]